MSFVFDEMHILFNTFYGCFGIIISTLAFSIFEIFENNESRAEVSFQLNPGKTINEFRVIMFMNILMLTGFLFYGIWGIIEFPVSLNIAKGLGLLFMFSMSVILFRWWRRFE